MHIHLLWVIHKKWPYVMFAQYKANKNIMHYNNTALFIFQENPLPYMESNYKNGTSVTISQDNSGTHF